MPKNKVIDFSFNSVEIIPDLKAAAAFTVNSSEVFKESEDISLVIIDKDLSYMPWGADNNLPYRVLDLIESDETLSTCQLFNAEVCYGSGQVYDSTAAKKKVQEQVALPTRFIHRPPQKPGTLRCVIYKKMLA